MDYARLRCFLWYLDHFIHPFIAIWWKRAITFFLLCSTDERTSYRVKWKNCHFARLNNSLKNKSWVSEESENTVVRESLVPSFWVFSFSRRAVKCKPSEIDSLIGRRKCIVAASQLHSPSQGYQKVLWMQRRWCNAEGRKYHSSCVWQCGRHILSLWRG